MTIKEFIKDYNEGRIETLKEALEVRDYAPFAEKYELCASVIDASNEVDEKTGLVRVDSVNRNLTFTIALLSLYTNLEFSLDEDEGSSIDEYDMLCQNKLLTPILELFAEEAEVCQDMLLAMQEDILENNNTLQNVVGNTVKNLLEIAEPFVDIVKDKIESFNLDLGQDNIDKYMKILETMTKEEL